MRSEEHKNKLKETLKDIIDTLDNTYYKMETELRKEILQHKENIDKINKETNELYSKLSYKTCEKIIKSQLPLRIKLFNKVECTGFGIKGNGLIEIYSTFNNSFPFRKIYYISEIKRILKIKDGD